MPRLFLKISVLILLLVGGIGAQAQQALITMKDSARVSTEIKNIQGNLLVVKEGALSLNLIAIVQFETEDSQAVRTALLEGLLKENIVVYFGREKFVKKTEIPVVIDTSQQVVNNIVNTVIDSVLVDKPIQETSKENKVEPEEDDEEILDFDDESDIGNLHLGIGIGLDYGGLGGRLTFIPGDASKTSVGIFVATGFALNGLGFNAGLNLRIGQQRLVPTISAMYGYNGVIKVIGASQYDKTYYGPSVAIGFENKTRNSNDNHIHLELVIPFRSAAFHNDIKALQNNPSIEISAPSPVLISIGYHFKI